MKVKRAIWLLVSLLAGLLMAACTLPLQPSAPMPAQPAQQGIDPTLLHAQGVLMHYCAKGQCDLRVIDPATGELFPAYPPFAVGDALFQPAPDRRTLAVIDYGESQYRSRGVLKFVDLAQWQLVTTTVKVANLSTLPLYSPDGATLAVAFPKYTWPPGERVQLIDVARRQLRAELELAFGVRQMRFSDDGQWLFLYGVDGSPDYTVNPQTHVALARIADLQIVWENVLPDVRHGFFNPDSTAQPHTDIENTVMLEPAVVFAPTGAQLYIAHADENRLTTVDFMAHTVHTTPINDKQGWVERLLAMTARVAQAKVFNGATKQAVIAPSGNYLYVTGSQHEYKEKNYQETPLGVQVIDLTRTLAVAHIDSAACEQSLSPDGKRLYLHCWGNSLSAAATHEWTEIVDTTTFRPIVTLPDLVLATGRRLDGQPILLSTITKPDGMWEAAALDPASLTVIHTWRAQQPEEWGWFIK